MTAGPTRAADDRDARSSSGSASGRSASSSSSRPVGSQRELVDALTEQGFDVTQATVSRDITELGLMKAPRADGHVYVAPGGRRRAANAPAPASDERLAAHPRRHPGDRSGGAG